MLLIVLLYSSSFYKTKEVLLRTVFSFPWLLSLSSGFVFPWKIFFFFPPDMPHRDRASSYIQVEKNLTHIVLSCSFVYNESFQLEEVLPIRNEDILLSSLRFDHWGHTVVIFPRKNKSKNRVEKDSLFVSCFKTFCSKSSLFTMVFCFPLPYTTIRYRALSYIHTKRRREIDGQQSFG